MKTLDKFYDLVMPELPGITTAMLDANLVLVAREICERTSAWRADFDPQDTVAAQATYDIDPSEPQSETVRVLRLTVNSVLLWDQNWNASPTLACESTNVDVPRYGRDEPPFSLSDDLLTLTLIDDEIPADGVSGGLLITGSMKPKVGATALPDFLLTVRAELLRTGVLSRLMRMGRKPWTDQGLSALYAGQYAQELNLAAAAAQQGNTRAPLRVRKWG